MLSGEHISKYYFDRNSRQRFAVLKDCSIHIGDNEIVGLMGSSGCGKSTLARILLRLIDCDDGKVIFADKDITNLKNSRLKDFRRSVQFISQRPESFFDPMMKLGKSLTEPQQIFQLNYSQETISETLELVKLNDSLLNRYPHQVSGGEIQRLSIARALLLNPKFLILDEPTSMLDISVQAQILHLLRDIQRQKKLSYLFISHDSYIINWLCDRRLKMDGGCIVY